jgi:hypothetical protein
VLLQKLARTKPNVFRAAVADAILSSFLWRDGSAPASKSFRAESRRSRASASDVAGKAPSASIF